MAELVDALDLGSSPKWGAGSSPVLGIFPVGLLNCLASRLARW